MRKPTLKSLRQDPELALLTILALYLSPDFDNAGYWVYKVWRHLPPLEQDYFDLCFDYVIGINYGDNLYA